MRVGCGQHTGTIRDNISLGIGELAGGVSIWAYLSLSGMGFFSQKPMILARDPEALPQNTSPRNAFLVPGCIPGIRSAGSGAVVRFENYGHSRV